MSDDKTRDPIDVAREVWGVPWQESTWIHNERHHLLLRAEVRWFTVYVYVNALVSPPRFDVEVRMALGGFDIHKTDLRAALHTAKVATHRTLMDGA
ncbi:MAG: hypothetical protein KC492_27450, partial [Myxococcales bacterium]|nr:hypothetical protein [Myxococcales bacterium]